MWSGFFICLYLQNFENKGRSEVERIARPRRKGGWKNIWSGFGGVFDDCV